MFMSMRLGIPARRKLIGRFGKARTELAREEIRVEVVGEDVGGGCIEERGRLKDDDVMWGNKCFKIVYDCGWCGFCLLWGSCVSVFGLPCIIGKYVDYDDVSGFECCASECVECLGECKSFMGNNVVIGCGIFWSSYDFEGVRNFVRCDIFQIAVMKDMNRRKRLWWSRKTRRKRWRTASGRRKLD